MSCCKWQIFSLKAFEDFFESTHYSGLLLQKEKVKRIHHAQTGEDAQRFTGSLPRIAAHLLKKMLEENIPSWEQIWTVTPWEQLWEHPPPSHLVLSLSPNQLWDYNTILFNSFNCQLSKWNAIAGAAGSLRRRSAPFSIRLQFPDLAETVSTTPHHAMRQQWDEVTTWSRVIICQMTEILYSFVDDKKVISQMLPVNTSMELAVRGANWASLQRRSGAAWQLLKMFPLPMEVPSAMKEATQQGKCTGKSHPENLTA